LLAIIIIIVQSWASLVGKC